MSSSPFLGPAPLPPEELQGAQSAEVVHCALLITAFSELPGNLSLRLYKVGDSVVPQQEPFCYMTQFRNYLDTSR